VRPAINDPSMEAELRPIVIEAFDGDHGPNLAGAIRRRAPSGGESHLPVSVGEPSRFDPRL
jgi:hypothetical protein